MERLLQNLPRAPALQADDLPKPWGGEMARRDDDFFPLDALDQGPPGLPGHLRVHVRMLPPPCTYHDCESGVYSTTEPAAGPWQMVVPHHACVGMEDRHEKTRYW